MGEGNIKITNTFIIKVRYPLRGWEGKIEDSESDVDGYGSLGCPKYLCDVL
jgi:hypothetical protein